VVYFTNNDQVELEVTYPCQHATNHGFSGKNSRKRVFGNLGINCETDHLACVHRCSWAAYATPCYSAQAGGWRSYLPNRNQLKCDRTKTWAVGWTILSIARLADGQDCPTRSLRFSSFLPCMTFRKSVGPGRPPELCVCVYWVQAQCNPLTAIGASGYGKVAD